MRQIFLLGLALLTCAAPRVALAQSTQLTGSVTLEVLDADTMAAIDADSNGIKRADVPPDKEKTGRRTATVPVPVGDSGTVYVARRGDTTVVDLVSEGRPAPPGAKAVGTYKEGGRVTLTGVALGIAPGATPSAVTQDPQPRQRRARRPIFGLAGGAGTAAVLDAIKNGCAEIVRELNATRCVGDDRGPAWTVGGEARWPVGTRADIGVNFGVTKPSGFEKEFGGNFGTATFTGTGAADLWLADLAVALGVSPTDRVRIYTRAGPSFFDVTRESSLTFRGQTDRSEEHFSGVGPRVFVGLDVRLTRNMWLSAQAGRTWMRDGAWREELSAKMVVMKFLFGA